MTTPLNPRAVEQLLQNAPVGALLVSPQGDIQWFNDTLVQLLGLEKERLAGQSTDQLKPELRNILIDPPDTLLLQRGNEQRWIRTHCQNNGDGSKFRYYLDASQEQQLRSERNQLADELRQLNTRDAITGLPNRQALLQALDPLVSRSRRYGNPLSVIKLDIVVPDSEALDTQGHHTMWQSVGQTLKDQMRWADIIGRWDNSRFLFILPETPETAARQLADKICTIVAHAEISDSRQQTMTLHPHCGISGWHKGDDAKLMLSRADEQMGAARQSGVPVI